MKVIQDLFDTWDAVGPCQ